MAHLQDQRLSVQQLELAPRLDLLRQDPQQVDQALAHRSSAHHSCLHSCLHLWQQHLSSTLPLSWLHHPWIYHWTNARLHFQCLCGTSPLCHRRCLLEFPLRPLQMFQSLWPWRLVEWPAPLRRLCSMNHPRQFCQRRCTPKYQACLRFRGAPTFPPTPIARTPMATLRSWMSRRCWLVAPNSRLSPILQSRRHTTRLLFHLIRATPWPNQGPMFCSPWQGA